MLLSENGTVGFCSCSQYATTPVSSGGKTALSPSLSPPPGDASCYKASSCTACPQDRTLASAATNLHPAATWYALSNRRYNNRNPVGVFLAPRFRTFVKKTVQVQTCHLGDNERQQFALEALKATVPQNRLLQPKLPHSSMMQRTSLTTLDRGRAKTTQLSRNFCPRRLCSIVTTIMSSIMNHLCAWGARAIAAEVDPERVASLCGLRHCSRRPHQGQAGKVQVCFHVQSVEERDTQQEQRSGEGICIETLIQRGNRGCAADPHALLHKARQQYKASELLHPLTPHRPSPREAHCRETLQ